MVTYYATFTFLLLCCQPFPFLCLTEEKQGIQISIHLHVPPIPNECVFGHEKEAKRQKTAGEARSATRRLAKELEDIKKSGSKVFRRIHVDEANILKWQGLIVPENPPFNKGAFKIQIDFPAEYPFKPPKILFRTKIYHPNVDEKGQVCLPIINAKNWKPATKTDQVIQALIALVHDPKPEHPLRADLAEEYVNDRQKFMRNAEEFTKKYSEKRPSD